MPISIPRERLFLILILTQAAHSVEEYVFRLYDVFAPAKLVSGVFSDDLATGFLIANAILVGFGLWCYAFPVRRGWPSGRGWAWFWTLLEFGNGVGHSLIAVSRGGYFPGTVTAVFLLAVSVTLGHRLFYESPREFSKPRSS